MIDKPIYIIPLHDRKKTDLAAAGGKGAKLIMLASAEFPVPPGFVLSTAAYRTFMGQNKLRASTAQLAAQISAADREKAPAIAAKIHQSFLDHPLPQGVKFALLDAYTKLTAGNETAVAVRSSATAEDLPQASFAGQHETFLNVRGEEALLEAVKACWASLWTARAISYRQRLGIDPLSISMAVIVQQMVPTEVSGVLFTANPTTGARDELLVNASFGLGEAVVSGQVTPDTYRIKAQDLSIIETTLGAKEIMIVPGDQQQTAVLPVPADQRTQPALSPRQLALLATLGKRVEEQLAGVPEDIEWAWDGHQFWLLQARPVTNLPPVPLKDVRWEPVRPGTIWMRRQVVEHMPDPLSPLFDELYLQQGLDQSMSELAVFMSDLSGIKIDVWEFIDPPFAATINGFAYSIASFNMSRTMVPMALRIYVTVLPKMIRHLMPRWEEESLPRYQESIAHWKSINLEETSDEDLLSGIRKLTYEDAIYWFAAAVPLGLARMSDAALNGFLKWVSPKINSADGSPLISGSFLRGFPSMAVEAQIELEAIARQVYESDTLRRLVLDTPAQTLLFILGGHLEGGKILNSLNAYFERYGHQIYNLDFAVPTLADDPLPALLNLKAAVAHPERDAQRRQAELAQARKTLETRTVRALNPLQRWLFQLLLRWAQQYAPNREKALFYVGAAWPAVRRLAHELGRRLTAAGSLFDADDVYYLRSAELAAAIADCTRGMGRPDLAALAQERRELREARKRLDPPVVVPEGGRMKFGPIDMAFFEPKPRAAGSGPLLKGFGVSPGRITAPASIIRSPEDFSRMKPDTILVCPTTTPAWTPLFGQARGLVTDIGGALAHGSIVAREYNIPAVMGTGEATARIKPGQLIEVDGSAGTVTLVDELEQTISLGEPVQPGLSKAKKFALAALGAGLIIAFLAWLRRRRR